MNREAKIGLFIVLVVAFFAAVLFGRAVSRRRAREERRDEAAAPASAGRDPAGEDASAREEAREPEPRSVTPPPPTRREPAREERAEPGRVEVAEGPSRLAVTAPPREPRREETVPEPRHVLAPSPAAPARLTRAPAASEHVVVEGDSLWSVASEHYGRAPTPGEIARLAEASGIEVESVLTIGQVLTIPAARSRTSRAAPVRSVPVSPVAPVAPAAREGQHVVAEGDSLWTIAMVRYGRAPTPADLRQIAEASGIEVESVLTVGQVLTLPALGARASRPAEGLPEY